MQKFVRSILALRFRWLSGENAFLKIHSTGCEAVSLYLSSSYAFPHRISCDLRGADGERRGGGYFDRALVGGADHLKTTAFLVAFPFLFATIPYAFYSKWPVAGIRKVLGSVEISLMTFLFMARIPYYEIFHQGFNIMLFNGMKDDKWAIFDTAVQQYALWPRLLGACVLMVVFVWLWLHVDQRTNVWSPKRHVRLWVLGVVVCLPILQFLSLRRGVSLG